MSNSTVVSETFTSLDKVKSTILKALAEHPEFEFSFSGGDGVDSIHMQLKLTGKLKPIELPKAKITKLVELTKKHGKLVGKKYLNKEFIYSGLRLTYRGSTSRFAYVTDVNNKYYRLPHNITKLALKSYHDPKWVN